MARVKAWWRALGAWPDTEAAQERVAGRALDVLLRTAAERPYYREMLAAAGVRPADLRSPRDLERLPVLSRAMVIARAADLMGRAPRPGLDRVERTNGTTGEPLVLHAAPAELRHKHMLWFGGYLRHGLRPWHRQAKMMMGASIPRTGWGFQKAGLFRRQYLAVAEPTAVKVEWLRTVRPDALFAWGSVLTEMALHLEDRDESFPIPLVVSSSEAVQAPVVRRRLALRLIDVYGAMETGPLAWACPAGGGYHLDSRGAWVELLDDAGRPARQGRVVCTVWWRRTVPLIRYDLGDLAVWGEGPCACGWRGRWFRSLEGRVVELLELPSGARVTLGVVGSSLRGLDGIRQYQMVQITPSDLRLRLRVGPEFSPAIRREAETRLRSHLDDSISLRVDVVDSIYRPPEGKLPPVVTFGRISAMRAQGLNPERLLFPEGVEASPR